MMMVSKWVEIRRFRRLWALYTSDRICARAYIGHVHPTSEPSRSFQNKLHHSQRRESKGAKDQHHVFSHHLVLIIYQSS